MHFIGLLILVILACLFLGSMKGCDRQPVGAMCYKVAAPQTTSEYTCPVCGQKTLYDKENTAWIVQSIETSRREFDLLVQVSPLKMKLDESNLCAKCSPNATEHQLVLTITYEDGTTRSITTGNDDNLRILRDYFQGRLTDSSPGKSPELVRWEIKRARELLGRDVPVPPQKQ